MKAVSNRLPMGVREIWVLRLEDEKHVKKAQPTPSCRVTTYTKLYVVGRITVECSNDVKKSLFSSADWSILLLHI